MTTTTMPAPRRITTWRYLVADLATAVFGPDHPGATSEWFQELREGGTTTRDAVSRPTDTPTAMIPPVRRPVAAIAATPHMEAVCPLDACPLDLGPLEPAAFFDADRYALIGAAA